VLKGTHLNHPRFVVRLDAIKSISPPLFNFARIAVFPDMEQGERALLCG